MLKVLPSLVLIFAAVAASASDKNTLSSSNHSRYDACAQISKTEGTNCSNLKVEMDVRKCGDPRRVVPLKIICEGTDAVGTYRSAKFDYRVVIVANRNWWGKTNWSLRGEIARVRRRQASLSQSVTSQTTSFEVPPLPAATETARSADEALGPHSAVPLVNANPLAADENLIAAEKAEEKVDQLLSLLTDLTVKGEIDLYYSFNLNRPANVSTGATPANSRAQNTYRVFDVYHDSFQMNYAHILVQKSAEPIGFTFDLAYGPAMQTVAGTLAEGVTTNVKQATLSYRFANGFILEAGRFVTHVGFEVIEATENWNYSRGLLFGFFDPFWHQGVKGTYAFSERVSAAFLLVNGWNNAVEFNDSKNIGAQLTYVISDAASIVFNFLSGNEPQAPSLQGGERKTIYDVLGVYKMTEDLSFAFNADLLTHVQASEQRARGAALYARYEFSEGWALSPRFEFVDDRDGLALAFSGGQTLSTYTLTLENKLSAHLAWRAELRSDLSDKEPFLKDGRPSKHQETATMALLGGF